jgi:hypothetical protein
VPFHRPRGRDGLSFPPVKLPAAPGSPCPVSAFSGAVRAGGCFRSRDERHMAIGTIFFVLFLGVTINPDPGGFPCPARFPSRPSRLTPPFALFIRLNLVRRRRRRETAQTYRLPTPAPRRAAGSSRPYAGARPCPGAGRHSPLTPPVSGRPSSAGRPAARQGAPGRRPSSPAATVSRRGIAEAGTGSPLGAPARLCPEAPRGGAPPAGRLGMAACPNREAARGGRAGPYRRSAPAGRCRQPFRCNQVPLWQDSSSTGRSRPCPCSCWWPSWPSP